MDMHKQNRVTTFIIFLPQSIKIYKKESFMLLCNNEYLIKIFLDDSICYLSKKNFFLTISGLEQDGKFLAWCKNLKNLIWGLSRNHVIRLFLKGVGFRANFLKKKEIELKLGYSHNLKKEIKKSLNINIYKNYIINLTSPFKDLLGVEASKIHFLRKPDSYKGKGVLFGKKPLLLKVGKKT